MRIIFIILGMLAVGNLHLIIENLALLSMILTGPVMIIAYLVFLSKNRNTDFSLAKPGFKISAVFAVLFTAASTTVQVLYIIQFPNSIA